MGRNRLLLVIAVAGLFSPDASAQLPGIIFDSNWDTALGSSDSAMTDGGRWTDYVQWDGPPYPTMAIVAGAGPNGMNAMRVQQRAGSYPAKVQKTDFAPQSKDFYLRYYFKTDDTSGSGDHIVTAGPGIAVPPGDNLTYMRKYGGASTWGLDISMYACEAAGYPLNHWGPDPRMNNGQWYRLEYHVEFVDSNHIRVHPRIYNAAGDLIFTDADFRQSGYGSSVWNGRSDWTLASYYASGRSHCVQPNMMNDFGLGNNGQAGASNTGLYWYFAAVQIRTDTWPGPAAAAGPVPAPIPTPVPVPTPTPTPLPAGMSFAMAPVQDTYLNTDAFNYSSSTVLRTYTWPDSQVANAILMKFDLSAIPAGAVVTDATLSLTLVQSDTKAEPTYTVTAHKLKKMPTVAAATGQVAGTGSPWATPMAQADISPPYDTQAVDKALGFKTWSLTTLVQEWLADPASNFGLLLNADKAKLADRHRAFASMEHADPSQRPSLRVVYTQPAGPTPPSELPFNCVTTSSHSEQRLVNGKWEVVGVTSVTCTER